MEVPFTMPVQGGAMERGMAVLGLEPMIGGGLGAGSRRKREFMPDEKKDASYWEKRRKNNEAAKRSREKRRVNDYVLETRLVALSEENMRLRAELLALRLRFGLPGPASAQHSLLPLPPSRPMDPFWGRWPRDGDHSSLPSAHPISPLSSVHTPATTGYSFGIDRYPPFASSHSPLFLPALLPHPPAHWVGQAAPRPILGPKKPSDEEAEQQVPAALEADLSTALPHKLRLKIRGQHCRPDSGGATKDGESLTPPRKILYMTD
ncbi:uncharacterized protein [Paramormyrops kingsleyae]|uniref:uncharacterized protein n=1 Tax=Paramormyrops kingsleyae TaxID=1676925 RepID=UPI003B977486